MGPIMKGDIVDRMRAAFALYDIGLAMMRQNFRRQYPDDSEQAIEQRLLDWRLHRADAPDGDGEGMVVTFPRSRQ